MISEKGDVAVWTNEEDGEQITLDLREGQCKIDVEEAVWLVAAALPAAIAELRARETRPSPAEAENARRVARGASPLKCAECGYVDCTCQAA
jgi:hypothetical protein